MSSLPSAGHARASGLAGAEPVSPPTGSLVTHVALAGAPRTPCLEWRGQLRTQGRPSSWPRPGAVQEGQCRAFTPPPSSVLRKWGRAGGRLVWLAAGQSPGQAVPSCSLLCPRSARTCLSGTRQPSRFWRRGYLRAAAPHPGPCLSPHQGLARAPTSSPAAPAGWAQVVGPAVDKPRSRAGASHQLPPCWLINHAGPCGEWRPCCHMPVCNKLGPSSLITYRRCAWGLR